MTHLRAVLARLREDLDTVIDEDPSIHSRVEALLHPHITALWLHRLAHRRYRDGRRVSARMLGLTARFVTGIEIHPGARIGRRFFVDHGAAVVIGETAVIGDNVMLYHQVTLGSLGWWKDREHPGERRHPVIEDDVIIGTNASVLGSITVGRGSRIGAHSVLTRSVPERSRVSVVPATVASLDGSTDVSITGEQARQGAEITAVTGAAGNGRRPGLTIRSRKV
jgi:serine O-acetyltransferase